MAYDSRPRRQNTGRQFYYVDYPPKVPYEELPQQKEALEARLTQLLEAQADFEAFSEVASLITWLPCSLGQETKSRPVFSSSVASATPCRKSAAAESANA